MAQQPPTQGPIQIPLIVDIKVRNNPTKLDGNHVPQITSYIENGLVYRNEVNNSLSVGRRPAFRKAVSNAVDIADGVRGYVYIPKLDKHARIIRTLFSDFLDWGGTQYDLGIGGFGATEFHYSLTHVESAGVDYLFIVCAVPTSTATAGYAWVFTGVTLTQLVVGTHGFPNTTKYMSNGAVSLDTYGFVLTTDGYIYNSNVGDILTWTSTDFIRVGDATDKKFQILKHHDHIAVIGTRSINFYYDAGNPNGSPLALRKDLTIPMGAIAYQPDGASTSFLVTPFVTSDDEYIVFFGAGHAPDVTSSPATEATGIYIIQNFNLKKISTPDIDLLINNNGTYWNNHMFITNTRGRKLLFITDLVSSEYNTIVYDFSVGLWYVWSWVGVFGPELPFSHSHGEFFVHRTWGGVYRLDYTRVKDQDYLDNTSFFPFTIVTPETSIHTSNNKLCRETTLIGEYTSGQEVVEVSWTDNSYITFSTARNYDLRYYRKLTRCGSFRKRAWKIRQTSSTTGISGYPVRLSHIEINVDPTSVNVMD